MPRPITEQSPAPVAASQRRLACQQFLVQGRIVNVVGNSGIAHLYIFDLRAMAVDHIANLRCGRFQKELSEYRPANQYRMPPAISEARYRNQGLGSQQSVDGRKRNRGMVHQGEEYDLRFVRNGS